jgi:predicted transcriptional regulator
LTTTIETLWERRDRLNILAEILDTATESKLKTQIMYKVNLSFNQVKEYLSYLTERGFLRVRFENRKKFYETTAKGNLFIKNYEEMSNLLRRPETVEGQILVR